MPGAQTVRDVLETLIKGLCSIPGGASVSLEQQPGVPTIFLVAAANPADTAFLQGGNLFPSLRIVTGALGHQQNSGLPCDFAVAPSHGVGEPPTQFAAMAAGADRARGMAGPGIAAAMPAERAATRKAKPARARIAATKAPRRPAAVAPKRRSKVTPSKHR